MGPQPSAERLQVSHASEEAGGSRQPAFRRALAGREPAIKVVTIYANSGGYDNRVLVRFSQVSLQNRHQLIWTRHFGCLHRKLVSSGFPHFAFAVAVDALIERLDLLHQLRI